MTIIDKACFERGCACYDDRVDKDGVAVVAQGKEHMLDLLRRAWNALDTFKQAYPENWHEEDEQVLNDLLKAALKWQDPMPLFDDWNKDWTK